ncbi:hypothetical protein [Bradyrhizobium sp. sBnM-33]|uniref:hypothetical protein n=1 Tax=Bradyrhizobium sp. sBnM-33 TaxID=2831780 RepID=UPI00293F54E7|nr:hypothetical protein [Bradyrhizobium sp. sBnM-33]WOH50402.1 hypothetical protein RX328_41375 [Bradyrhizobium sp. sBnM-33]
MKGKTSYALPKEQKENTGGEPRQAVREPPRMHRAFKSGIAASGFKAEENRPAP